ncbi:MAG: DUF4199 domain-containing protein [Chitinophagaceae bacterium]|nr:DUF4199 domain-containing protein [Chitinophagaceae bacterium]
MKTIKIEIKWALIFLLMTLAWMFLEKLVGLHSIHIDKHPFYTMFYMVPAILVYVLALKDKKENFYNGQMNYLQAFISGLILTGIITLLTPLSQYIVSTWITPSYFQHAIAYAIKNTQMDAATAEEYFSLKNYIIQGVMGAPIMGTITTAIVAFFLRAK